MLSTEARTIEGSMAPGSNWPRATGLEGKVAAAAAARSGIQTDGRRDAGNSVIKGEMSSL